MSWVRGIVPQTVAEAGTSAVPYLWTPLRVRQASGAPRGDIAGLSLSNNGADATNDIDIAVGEASDDGVAGVPPARGGPEATPLYRSEATCVNATVLRGNADADEVRAAVNAWMPAGRRLRAWLQRLVRSR
mgnify:CR=1 FL=1